MLTEMRSILISLIMMCVCVGNINAAAQVVKNEDKPAKGEWNFDLQKVWTLEDASKDFFLDIINTIRIDDDGKVYMLSRKVAKVFIFSDQGKFLSSFGRKGEGPGEFMRPQILFLVDNHIIVMDTGNNQMHYFTKTGAFKKSFRIEPRTFPIGFIDSYNFVIHRLRQSLQSDVETLENCDIKTGEKTIIKKIAAQPVAVISGSAEDGTVVTAVIHDRNTFSTQVMTLKDDKIYFAQSDNYLIRKLDLKGNTLLSFSIEGRKRKPASPEYKDSRVEQMIVEEDIPRSMKKHLLENIPDSFTYFNRIIVDEKGLIYVYRTLPSPQADQEIDIFSPGGKYLYYSVVKLPKGFQRGGMPILKGNHMYITIMTKDEDDELQLVKFKIKKPVL